MTTGASEGENPSEAEEVRPPATAVVIGGGTMGAGIAQVLAQSGVAVTVAESSPEAAEAALARIIEGLRRAHRTYDDPEAAAAAVGERLSVGTERPPGPVDLVVEAVPEIMNLKMPLLAELSRQYTGCLLGSNTSSLSITEMAQVVERPERFCGLHFFNPVPRSELIEIVTGEHTGDDTVAAAVAWAGRLSKTPIVVRDSPGFATSRLGLALGLEAIRMLESAVASADDIDRAMTLGYKHPIGPLALTDLVGLDVRLGIAEYLASTLGERFEPPQLLRDMVAAGKLGKKTGEGFHRWDS